MTKYWIAVASADHLGNALPRRLGRRLETLPPRCNLAYQFRFGLFEFLETDLSIIANAMAAEN